ncbi:MAG: S1 RNA-binding domain-containing protein [Lachnospiraceae bacterium]
MVEYSIEVKNSKEKYMTESMKDFEKELEASYETLKEEEQLLETMSEEEMLLWENLKQNKENKDEIDVKIKEIVKGGAVAFVGEIRGFIPASKLSASYVEDLNEFLNQHIKVRVFEVDPEKKKLILSAKEILREQEQAKRKEAMKEVSTGDIYEGVVETIQPYGAFVKLENGLSGLVHISQLSPKHVKTPNEVVKQGETVKVKVIALKEGKISLSIKALQEDDSEVVDFNYKLPKTEDLTTSLGSLFKNIKISK